MKNMQRKTREGAEQYAEPRMEIIELSEESVVYTSPTIPVCTDDEGFDCFEEDGLL